MRDVGPRGHDSEAVGISWWPGYAARIPGQKGRIRGLPTLGGDCISGVVAINNRGQVIETCDTKSGDSGAVLWTYRP